MYSRLCAFKAYAPKLGLYVLQPRVAIALPSIKSTQSAHTFDVSSEYDLKHIGHTCRPIDVGIFFCTLMIKRV